MTYVSESNPYVFYARLVRCLCADAAGYVIYWPKNSDNPPQGIPSLSSRWVLRGNQYPSSADDCLNQQQASASRRLTYFLPPLVSVVIFFEPWTPYDMLLDAILPFVVRNKRVFKDQLGSLVVLEWFMSPCLDAVANESSFVMDPRF